MICGDFAIVFDASAVLFRGDPERNRDRCNRDPERGPERGPEHDDIHQAYPL